VQAETGRIYSVCYSERFWSRAAAKADELIQAGAIGKVIQTLSMGPHHKRFATRPEWFFVKEKYGGILTDIGIDTILAEKKEIITVDGRRVIIEPALRADVALIHAATADPFGNLVYKESARNFNPTMATAAKTVIVETEKLVKHGELDPDQIHTPGGFIDHVVVLEELSDEYGILEHHVL
jgi:hypothetical protein